MQPCEDLGALSGKSPDEDLKIPSASTTRTARRCASSTPTARRSPGRRRPRGLPRAAGGLRAPPEHTSWFVNTSRKPKSKSGRSATTPGHPHRLVLRAAAARPHQVDRDGGLLRGGRRLPAHPELAAGRRSHDPDPLEELSKAFLHRSAQTASKYDDRRKTRASTCAR